MTRRRRVRFWLGSLLALSLLLLLPRPGQTAEQNQPLRFYYFNPDSLQSNLGQLKSAMDTFLAETGARIVFQPFTHLVDLSQLLKEQPPAFVLLPHWFRRDRGPAARLRPLLQPLRNGSSDYRKILLTNVDAPITIHNLAGRSLAMTPLGPDQQKLLGQLLFRPHGLQPVSLDIVEVPKDSDALFALALGQVELALVAKDNIDAIADVNPRILNTLRPLLQTAPIPLPVIYYLAGKVDSGQIKAFQRLFLRAEYAHARARIMELLKIDAWQTVLP